VVGERRLLGADPTEGCIARAAQGPGSRSVRGMPIMQRSATGMPTAASRAISPQMLSISRRRSGSLPGDILEMLVVFGRNNPERE